MNTADTHSISPFSTPRGSPPDSPRISPAMSPMIALHREKGQDIINKILENDATIHSVQFSILENSDDVMMTEHKSGIEFTRAVPIRITIQLKSGDVFSLNYKNKNINTEKLHEEEKTNQVQRGRTYAVASEAEGMSTTGTIIIGLRGRNADEVNSNYENLKKSMHTLNQEMQSRGAAEHINLAAQRFLYGTANADVDAEGSSKSENSTQHKANTTQELDVLQIAKKINEKALLSIKNDKGQEIFIDPNSAKFLSAGGCNLVYKITGFKIRDDGTIKKIGLVFKANSDKADTNSIKINGEIVGELWERGKKLGISRKDMPVENRFYNSDITLMTPDSEKNEKKIEAGERTGAATKLYKLGDLDDVIKKHNLTPEEKESIAGQIIKAGEFFREIGATHSDIKPGNFFIDMKIKNGKRVFRVRLSDMDTVKFNDKTKAQFRKQLMKDGIPNINDTPYAIGDRSMSFCSSTILEKIESNKNEIRKIKELKNRQDEIKGEILLFANDIKEAEAEINAINKTAKPDKSKLKTLEKNIQKAKESVTILAKMSQENITASEKLIDTIDKNSHELNLAADRFAIGVTLFKLYSQEEPFPMSTRDGSQDTSNKEFNMNALIRAGCSEDRIFQIRELLTFTP